MTSLRQPLTSFFTRRSPLTAMAKSAVQPARSNEKSTIDTFLLAARSLDFAEALNVSSETIRSSEMSSPLIRTCTPKQCVHINFVKRGFEYVN